MQPDFWLGLWDRGHIHFQQPAASRYLDQHWQMLKVESAGTVFVPLCGKSLDMVWLRDHGHAVIGVELANIALETFCVEHGIPARRRIEPRFDVYDAPGFELLCGDFFDISPARLGPIAAIYDRAALISWSADMREAYARHMTSLTPSGISTLLVTLEYPQEQKSGPPFSVTTAEVARLYAGHHSIEELSRGDILSSEPRLRVRGITQLHEVCYRLTRL
jgi:thiopurine S-methyltransferase